MALLIPTQRHRHGGVFGMIIISASQTLTTGIRLTAGVTTLRKNATTTGDTFTGNVTISGSNIVPLTVGSTSARKYVKIGNQWPEIRFHNADHELQRLGFAHQNESNYGGLDEGDFYIYDPTSARMRIRIPKDGGSLVRDQQYTIVDTGNLATTLRLPHS